MDEQDYIESSFLFKSDAEMGYELGICAREVANKRGVLKLKRVRYVPSQEGYEILLREMTGLVNFIHNQKSGITVDIAKRRLRELQNK